MTSFLIRFWALSQGGGLHGGGNYDDGVHFMTSLNLVGGRLPYRDFLFLHPPGLILLLVPFALAADVVGEPHAFVLARLGWMALGSANAVLCWAVVRRLHAGAAVIAGLCYAVLVPAIVVEVTPLLEAPPTTALLAAILLARLIEPDPPALPVRRAVVVGAVIGLCPVIKIWGVVVVAALLVGIGLRFGRRTVFAVGIGALLTQVAFCLPFFLAAPAAMWQMVVLDQLGRAPMRVSAVTRVNDLLGQRFWLDLDTLTSATVVGSAVLLMLFTVCLLRPHLRPLAVLGSVTGALLLYAPSWFSHYPALFSPILVIMIGATLAELAQRLDGHPRLEGCLLAASGMVLLVALSMPLLSGQVRVGGRPFPAAWAAAAVANRPGCVSSDLPAALIAMDVVGRNLERGCRIDTDLSGMTYHLRATLTGSSPTEARDRWREYVLAYLGSGDITLQTRYRRASLGDAVFNEIRRWPVADRAKPYVFRIPPAGTR